MKWQKRGNKLLSIHFQVPKKRGNNAGLPQVKLLVKPDRHPKLLTARANVGIPLMRVNKRKQRAATASPPTACPIDRVWPSPQCRPKQDFTEIVGVAGTGPKRRH
ncbi:MAG: hypothetical protein CM15mP74_29220 [Halieaceae bacterium]|nr:MAG: hypothetical protein CM15mP74_29220 [Halieaceae bacterium]